MADKIADFRDIHPDLAERPFVLNTFSNNGLQTWDQLQHNFERPNGFIFDSGPALPNEMESFPIPGRIFAANNPNAPFLQKALVAAVGNSVYLVVRHMMSGKSDLGLMPDVLIPRLSRDMINGLPSIVLFGQGDLLVPESSAQRVVDMLREQGEQVEYHVLNGGHCTILRDDRENYVKLVEKFLKLHLSSE